METRESRRRATGIFVAMVLCLCTMMMLAWYLFCWRTITVHYYGIPDGERYYTEISKERQIRRPIGVEVAITNPEISGMLPLKSEIKVEKLVRNHTFWVQYAKPEDLETAKDISDTRQVLVSYIFSDGTQAASPSAHTVTLGDAVTIVPPAISQYAPPEAVYLVRADEEIAPWEAQLMTVRYQYQGTGTEPVRQIVTEYYSFEDVLDYWSPMEHVKLGTPGEVITLIPKDFKGYRAVLEQQQVILDEGPVDLIWYYRKDELQRDGIECLHITKE